MLFYNEIIPGQKIKYQDLANKIGVSITPVIHALKWLEFKNIVRHEPNRGYFVNEVSLKEIRELYDSRLSLEVSLVPEIVKYVDKETLVRVQSGSPASAGLMREFHTRRSGLSWRPYWGQLTMLSSKNDAE